MSMTESILDFTILEALDWDQVCESNWHIPGYRPFIGSERPPAKWIIDWIFPCHPYSKLICERCREKVLKTISLEVMRVACVHCGDAFFPGQFSVEFKSLQP